MYVAHSSLINYVVCGTLQLCFELDISPIDVNKTVWYKETVMCKLVGQKSNFEFNSKLVKYYFAAKIINAFVWFSKIIMSHK